MTSQDPGTGGGGPSGAGTGGPSQGPVSLPPPEEEPAPVAS